MTDRFDRDTAVARMADGVFEGRIDRGWWIVRGPNGGYVAALVLRALEAAVGDPERAARSLTIHYTAPPAEGPVRVETCLERIGRSLTTVSGRLVQDGRLLALALAAFSRPWSGAGFHHAKLPEVPPPERCAPLPRREGAIAIPIRERYELRWCVGDPPGSRSARAQVGGWIRTTEPHVPDAPLVAAFTDAWPPACFSVAPEPAAIGPVPTVDLTIHFRTALPQTAARPGDFVLAAFQSRVAREGFVEEDGEIWSAGGELLAQSRQLAVLMERAEDA